MLLLGRRLLLGISWIEQPLTASLTMSLSKKGSDIGRTVKGGLRSMNAWRLMGEGIPVSDEERERMDRLYEEAMERVTEMSQIIERTLGAEPVDDLRYGAVTL